MTPEQFVAVLGGVAGILTAMALLIRQLGELRKDLDGRLQQLIEAAALAAGREGEMAGRDFERRTGDKETPGPNGPGVLPLEK